MISNNLELCTQTSIFWDVTLSSQMCEYAQFEELAMASLGMKWLQLDLRCFNQKGDMDNTGEADCN